MNYFIKNIIDKIKFIESSPVYESKYIGDDTYFVYTREYDDFTVLTSLKIAISDLFKIYPMNRVVKMFRENGYEIVVRTISNDSGYIKTKKGIITFIFIDTGDPILLV